MKNYDSDFIEEHKKAVVRGEQSITNAKPSKRNKPRVRRAIGGTLSPRNRGKLLDPFEKPSD